MTSPKAVVLASGGLDSATAVAVAKENGCSLNIIHTSYGQKTEDKEYECAKSLASHFGATDFLHLKPNHLSKIGSSSLTGGNIDVEDSNSESEDIPTSYVPFRNANLLAMAVSYAEANECSSVYIGAHTEDFAGYPDCRPEFFEGFQRIVDTGTKPETDISIKAPFVKMSKSEIIERGIKLNVPFEKTWSCYRTNEPACGTCDSCTIRLEAFREVGVSDPIDYD